VDGTVILASPRGVHALETGGTRKWTGLGAVGGVLGLGALAVYRFRDRLG